MRNLALFALAPWIALHAAGTSPAVVVSAADPAAGVTADSLATVWGDHLATVTAAATSMPWPTSLGDMPSVSITDSAGSRFQARLLFVSPDQMNLWIPPGVALGAATLALPVTGLPPGAGTAALRNVPFTVQQSTPALFSIGTTGIAAASAVRVVIPTHFRSDVPVFQCSAGGTCVAVPIDVGVDAPVYVSFYGTGWRRAGNNVTVTIGGVTLTPRYAGAQPEFPGLDQVDVSLPISLRGAGMVKVTVTAGGVTSDPVTIAIQ
ncbi:MAG: hypothetical protein JST11_06605 [Acidobacteria bacterium]|nr:hypothetical protein [Acidobacteriota bacterium]